MIEKIQSTIESRMATLDESWLNTSTESFGPSRCMFESNFPVDKISGSYANYWNAFKRLAGGTSEDEKADLFNRTARRFYRL